MIWVFHKGKLVCVNLIDTKFPTFNVDGYGYFGERELVVDGAIDNDHELLRGALIPK